MLCAGKTTVANDDEAMDGFGPRAPLRFNVVSRIPLPAAAEFTGWRITHPQAWQFGRETNFRLSRKAMAVAQSTLAFPRSTSGVRFLSAVISIRFKQLSTLQHTLAQARSTPATILDPGSGFQV